MNTSNNQQPISHHYVPQFYLKQFSNKRNNEHFVYVFDKTLKKVFPANIKNVCCENYFYDFMDKIPYSYYEKFPPNESKSGKKIKKIKYVKNLFELKEDVEPTFCMPPEIFLNNIETEFSEIYRKVIDLEDISQLSDYERAVSATFFVIQWKRTKAQRNAIKKLILESVKEKIGITNSVEEIINLLHFYYNCDLFIPFLHIRAMIYTEFALEVFFGMGWTLFINETSLPYWTSDNPVVISNITSVDPYSAHQIREGCKLYFPLTPKICLLMYDPSFYEFPSKMLDTDIQSVSEKNKLQLDNSMRHLFSYDDISLVNELINDKGSMSTFL